MRCSEFIDHYSDYRDGLIADPFTRRRFERHVRSCAQCRRYDQIIRLGVSELHRDAVSPSRAFGPGLRWRLAAARRTMARPRAAWPAGLAAALLVTAVVWEGVARTSEQIEIPAPLPGRPVSGMPTLVEHPYATFTDLDAALWDEEPPPENAQPVPLEYPVPYRLVTYQADAPQ